MIPPKSFFYDREVRAGVCLQGEKKIGRKIQEKYDITRDNLKHIFKCWNNHYLHIKKYKITMIH